MFRVNRSQAVQIPLEFELPGDRVLIRRDGGRLIIEPVLARKSLVELLAAWRTEDPLDPEDQLPIIEDVPARPEEVS